MTKLTSVHLPRRLFAFISSRSRLESDALRQNLRHSLFYSETISLLFETLCYQNQIVWKDIRSLCLRQDASKHLSEWHFKNLFGGLTFAFLSLNDPICDIF